MSFERMLQFRLKVPKKERSIEKLLKEAKQSVNPWAFIRVHNEVDILEDSLNSIKGAINRGIIAYHDCTDGSEEIIHEFCMRNKSFLPLKYENDVIKAGDIAYLTKCSIGKSLADYYNYSLSYIPGGDWFVKIDCDHIYDTEKLKKAASLPVLDLDCIILSSLNCCYVDDKVWVYIKKPVIERGDHWIIRKYRDTRFRMNIGYNDAGIYHAWEELRLKNYRKVYTEMTNWHFLFNKPYRKHLLNKNDFMPIDEWGLLYGDKYPRIGKEMYDLDYIKQYIKTMRPYEWASN